MSVQDNFHPTHKEKTTYAMKAPYADKRTFDRSEANPGETLNVYVPKLNENEVLDPGSLALRFDIDPSGGHANNFLMQNVSRALVSQLIVKFGGSILDDTVDYDIYKIFTTTWCLRASRAKICARFAQALETKKTGELTLRQNWQKFTARSITSTSTIRA